MRNTGEHRIGRQQKTERRKRQLPQHFLFLDGVYRVGGDKLVFQPVRAPADEQLQILLSRIIKRIMKLLTRIGYLLEEEGMTYMAETEPNIALAPLQSTACTYRIALDH